MEVDEEGHACYECEDEDSRLEIIAADLGRPGLVVRIDPDFKGQQCFRKVQLSNGENLKSSILNEKNEVFFWR